jgi:chromosome segregation ATPase
LASDKSNRRVRELENAIETGAEEMLETRMKVQALEKEGAEKDKNISALITALEKYREDVTRLEQLVTQLESQIVFKVQEAKDVVQAETEQQVLDLEAKVAAEERGRRAAETSAVDRLTTIKDLEAKMETAQRHVFDVQVQLNALAASKEEEEFKLKKKLHERDEQSQAQLGALNTRISNLRTALASANAEVEKLKVHKMKLEERVKKEVELGERAVEVIKAELIKSLGKVNETKNSYHS